MTPPRTIETQAACWLIESPLTLLWIECDDAGIVRIALSNESPSMFADRIDSGFNRRFQTQHAWVKPLLGDLAAYLRGEVVELVRYPVNIAHQPPFRRKVLEACRRVPYGAWTTYAGLAAAVGNPKAVCAVGSAMSHNSIPIVIPCHRVLRSDGRVGGFSAPEGVGLKERMLAIEANGKTQG